MKVCTTWSLLFGKWFFYPLRTVVSFRFCVFNTHNIHTYSGCALQSLHCKEIWIYFFPEKEMRGLCSDFHIHVSVSDLYTPTFGPPIVLQQNKQTDQGNI
jgi:hypothetical protein